MNQSSDTKRLLLAVVVSTAILIVWYSLFPPAPPRSPTAGEEPVAGRVEDGPEGEAPLAARPEKEDPYGDVPAEVVAELVAEGRQRIRFSNHDGQIVTWSILEDQYRIRAQEDGPKRPFEFVSPIESDFEVGTFLPPLLDIRLGGRAANGVYEVVETAPDAVALAWTDPATGVKVTRRYTLDPAHYSLIETVTLQNPGGSPVAYELSGLLRAAQNDDEAGGGFFTPPIHVYEGLCGTADDLERHTIEDVAEMQQDPDEDARYTEGVQWGGVDSRYFLTALLPEGEAAIRACEMAAGPEAARVPAENIPPRTRFIATRIDLPGGEIPAGGTVTQTVRFFGGPKKYDVLAAMEPPLTEAVDFGIFRVVSVPMLWLMKRFHDLFGNWGLAIILLTVLVKLVTLPLTHKQYKSMAGMKAIQPQLKTLQEKYKDDRLRLQQEMMKLYKEHNVNPLAGCLPILMMMPVYIALYRTIYSAVELYQADFVLWIHDLSEPDATYLLPLLLGGLMILQTRLSPTVGDSTQQKIMMYVMPVVFTAMMAVLPSGLVLYIAVNTVLGIAQQWWLLRGGDGASGAPAPARAQGR